MDIISAELVLNLKLSLEKGDAKLLVHALLKCFEVSYDPDKKLEFEAKEHALLERIIKTVEKSGVLDT